MSIEPMMHDLQALIAELAQDRSLDKPAQVRQRIEALDRLEVYLLDGQGQSDHAGRAVEIELYDRAEALYTKLETINRDLYQAIRHEIQQGGQPGPLVQWVKGLYRDSTDSNQPNGESYDYLDVVINGVLRFEEPGVEVAELAAEMVFYQPTPARHIFDFIDRAEIIERDVVVDIGSGMGNVPLLTSICTGASSIGIEREAAYVACARQSASALGLTNVTFIQQDAREADFSSGTVFYLYTPFTGTILRSVLDSLRREAAGREIRICTLGPCTPTVAEEPWLESVGAVRTDRPAIFHSRN